MLKMHFPWMARRYRRMRISVSAMWLSDERGGELTMKLIQGAVTKAPEASEDAKTRNNCVRRTRKNLLKLSSLKKPGTTQTFRKLIVNFTMGSELPKCTQGQNINGSRRGCRMKTMIPRSGPGTSGMLSCLSLITESNNFVNYWGEVMITRSGNGI